MHTEVHEFVKQVRGKFPEYFEGKRVLEVGSLDINGSVRQYFRGCDYTGLDLGEGSGVDVICPINLFYCGECLIVGEYQPNIDPLPRSLEQLEEAKYDVVISTEMLEHDKWWESSLDAMYQNLRSGGILILTCAGPNRHEHGTTRTTPGDAPFTNDYYRNISIEDFTSILPHTLFKESDIKLVRGDCDLVFYGIKK